MFKTINSTKTRIYWVNSDKFVDPDDVVHWWGSDDLSPIKSFTGRIILSPSDDAYLDVGFGGPWGTGFGEMVTWR